MKTKFCKNCKQEFFKKYNDSKTVWYKKIFCSKVCSNKYNKGYLKLVGLKRPSSVQKIMKNTQFKKGSIPWNKEKPHLSIRGENHPNWKGGKKNLLLALRASLEYKLWRKSVFSRDNYKCVWCGHKGYLEADHIKPFAYFPELRFVVDNGRTLCKSCHRLTDTYAEKAKGWQF